MKRKPGIFADKRDLFLSMLWVVVLTGILLSVVRAIFLSFGAG